MQVLEYNYYSGTLQIGVHTPRLNPVPATVFLAGGIHAEFGAKVRSALREYKSTENLATGFGTYLPQQGGLPLYGVRKVRPDGSLRSVDDTFNTEVTLLRFTIEFALYDTTFAAADEISHAFERNFEAATKALLAAAGLPDLTIPGDGVQLDESYIDIMFEAGAAQEQGDIQVAG